MRGDKKEAFDLRKAGSTYNEIAEKLGVSKGTLSFWFKGVDWSKDITEKNFKFNYSPQKILKMHLARKNKLKKHYQDAKNEALDEHTLFSTDPLFMSGIMLYAGEGDHSEKNNMVRITNSNPRVILIFKRFLEKFYPEFVPKIRISLLLYPDHIPADCVKYWADSLGVSWETFFKPVHITGRRSSKRLQYGVGSLIISSNFFKKKILELERCSLEKMCAAIV